VEPEFTVVIPARMRSTRLPGKMLADIGGKPLVAWVAERAKASGAKAVCIATDHDDIARAVTSLGWQALKTSEAHETGTDRLAEAAALLGLAPDEIVVNVQGDEPLIDPRLIREVAAALAARPEASIATAAHPIETAAAFFDPNVVKSSRMRRGARSTSRARPSPARDSFAKSRDALPPDFPALRHIGIYAYRVRFLREYASLQPTAAERFEASSSCGPRHGHRIPLHSGMRRWKQAWTRRKTGQSPVEARRSVIIEG
jgi:3-deoxy-manno-octulosonate cytidylyltransferase (CMP-KDO synthetase)